MQFSSSFRNYFKFCCLTSGMSNCSTSGTNWSQSATASTIENKCNGKLTPFQTVCSCYNWEMSLFQRKRGDVCPLTKPLAPTLPSGWYFFSLENTWLIFSNILHIYTYIYFSKVDDNGDVSNKNYADNNKSKQNPENLNKGVQAGIIFTLPLDTTMGNWLASRTKAACGKILWENKQAKISKN